MSVDHEFTVEHEFVEPLLAEAALGTVEPALRARVDAHLVACAACRTTFEELGDAVAGLEQALQSPARSLEPRAGARESLLVAARSTPQVGEVASAAPARRRARWGQWLAAGIPVAACIVLALVLVDRQSQIASLEDDLSKARGDQVPVLKGASVDEFEIGGPFDGTRAGVVLKRDAGIVTFRKVPAPPEGMAWHVWAVDDDDHIVPLGTIADERDLVILPIEGVDPKDVERIIVTTEAVDATTDPDDPDAVTPDEGDAVAEGTI